MTDYTSYINDKNVNNVRRQISLKQGSDPYWSTENMGKNVLTDFDSFPYKRWFRGDYKSSEPIVAERESGFRRQDNRCYGISNPLNPVNVNYPNHCFEVACSTVYPCYPKNVQRMEDHDALNVAINKSCITQYR